MPLTPQESRITAHIATGRTTKMVSEDLHISTATVNNHKANIYRKLNVRNAGELSKWWFCKTFNIAPEDVDQAVRSVGALICIILIVFAQFYDNDYQRGARRARRSRRKDQSEWVIEA